MIKPFTITLEKTSLHNRYYFHNHRRNRIAVHTKLPEGFVEKVLSHPITAFAYRFVGLGIPAELNHKFYRNEVLKSLDFWLDYFVHQNKIDYMMEGTVNVDFELTVKGLILTREAVLKEKADTQFVRRQIKTLLGEKGEKTDKHFSFESGTHYYKFRDNEVDTNMTKAEIAYYSVMSGLKFPKPKPKKLALPKSLANKDGMIEYTENVVSRYSNAITGSSDQFCYKVVSRPYKEYVKSLNKHQKIKYDYTENFRDGPRFIPEFASQIEAMIRTMQETSSLSATNRLPIGRIIRPDSE